MQIKPFNLQKKYWFTISLQKQKAVFNNTVITCHSLLAKTDVNYDLHALHLIEKTPELGWLTHSYICANNLSYFCNSL